MAKMTYEEKIYSDNLTDKDKKILGYIEEQWYLNGGFTPSYREICKGLNIGSTSTVYASIRKLEEKGYITEKAKSRNISVNQFIKNCIFDEQENKDSNTGGSDIGNDITRDIISILNEQLQAKDEQIKNLQTIIYNRDTKLLETTNKHWWQFWK